MSKKPWSPDLQPTHNTSRLIQEQIIARYIRPVAEDLRLLDLQLLAQQLSRGHLGNIESIVEASCELYFRDQTLKFCQLGTVELAWGKKPVVKIDLRFNYKDVVAAFLLVLDADHAGLELSYIDVERQPSDEQRTKFLERRLRQARRKWSMSKGYRRLDLTC